MPSSAPKEQPPLTASSTSYEEDGDEDEEDPVFLQAMLAKAELLANEIKATSVAASRAGSSSSTFVRGGGSLPDSIELKDNVTECSSVGYGLSLVSTTEDFCSVHKTATNDSKEQEMEGSDFFAHTKKLSESGGGEGQLCQDEKKSCDEDEPPAMYDLPASAAIDSNLAVRNGYVDKDETALRKCASLGLSASDVDAAVRVTQEKQAQTASVVALPSSDVEETPRKTPLHVTTIAAAPFEDRETTCPVLQVESVSSVPKELQVDEPSTEQATATIRAKNPNEAIKFALVKDSQLKTAVDNIDLAPSSVEILDGFPAAPINVAPPPVDKPKGLLLPVGPSPPSPTVYACNNKTNTFEVDAAVKIARVMEPPLKAADNVDSTPSVATMDVAPRADDDPMERLVPVGSSPSDREKPKIAMRSTEQAAPTVHVITGKTKEEDAAVKVAQDMELQLKEAIPSSSLNVIAVDFAPTRVSSTVVDTSKVDKTTRLPIESPKQAAAPVHSSGAKTREEGSAFDVDPTVEAVKEIELFSSLPKLVDLDVAPTEVSPIAVSRPPEHRKSIQLVPQVGSSPSQLEEHKTEMPWTKQPAAMHPNSNEIRRESATLQADAAVKAAQEMEQQLRAAFNLDSKFSNMTIPDVSLATTTLVTSSVAISRPENEQSAHKLRQDESSSQLEEQKMEAPSAKQTAASMQTTLHSGNATTHWEGTTFASETDEDYVPIADYISKSSRPSGLSGTGGQNGDKSAVRWERVTSAYEGDDDYMPMRDYSSPVNSRSQDINDPELLELTYSGHRAVIRRRRKKRRRRLVVLIGVSVFVMFFVLLRRFYSVVEIEKEVEPEVKEEVGDLALEAAHEYPFAEGETVSEEGCEATCSETTAIVMVDENLTLQDEFIICQLPFASIISPICRSAQKKGLRPPDGQERRRMIEELVQNMMQ